MSPSKNTPRQVVIVDDDPDIRAALVAWLATDYEVLSFESAEAVLQAISTGRLVLLARSLVLLDVQLTGMNGLKLFEHLQQQPTRIGVVLMSGVARQDQIVKAWRDGANDFLLKPFDINELTETLERCFAQIEASIGARSPELQYAKNLLKELSPREAGVLLLLAAGNKQQQVADELGIALRTVKKHRANIALKLGLESLADLIRFCDEFHSEIALVRDRDHSDGRADSA